MYSFYRFLRSYADVPTTAAAAAASSSDPSSSTTPAPSPSTDWFPPAPTGSLPVIPPFSEFSHFSMVKLLTGDMAAKKELEFDKTMFDANETAGRMVRTEIAQWVDEVKLTLGKLLRMGPPGPGNGYGLGNGNGAGPSTSPSSSSLPAALATTTLKDLSQLDRDMSGGDQKRRDQIRRTLVDRTSSLFLCRLCEFQAPQYSPHASGEGSWRALSLSAVVRHSCRGPWAKDGILWSINHFAPDWQAISALREVLEKAGIDEEVEDVRVVKEKMAAIERRVRCDSCEVKMVVPLKDIVSYHSLPLHGLEVC